MKKLVSFLVSAIILIIIYWRIDFSGLVNVLMNSDLTWIIISLGMVIPITLITAWRLQMLVPLNSTLSFLQSNRLILLASVLNMVLPSKMGDIFKAYFIKDTGALSGSMSLSLVVFEKSCDMLSLLLWCTFGLIIYPQKDVLFWIMTMVVLSGFTIGSLLIGSKKFADIFFWIIQKIAPNKFLAKVDKLVVSWHEYRDFIWLNQPQFIKVAGTSVFIWFLHLLQIWFFIFALREWVPLTANLALAPLSLLAGLLPLTFAGIGTRDAALIFFFQPFMSAPTGAALGLLCTSRYIMPALAGVPFLWKYSNQIQRVQKQSEIKENQMLN